jgi:hypothetical protein
MHLTKGLEFEAVVVMTRDDKVLPFQLRIESVADEVEFDNVYETERHLLYAACTRARAVNPTLEFRKVGSLGGVLPMRFAQLVEEVAQFMVICKNALSFVLGLFVESYGETGQVGQLVGPASVVDLPRIPDGNVEGPEHHHA